MLALVVIRPSPTPGGVVNVISKLSRAGAYGLLAAPENER